MSGYNGGQFDDADGSIERRIQEELRARQAASARVTGALSRTGFTDRAFMSSLIAAESAAAAAGQAGAPFYPHPGAAGAHSPFGRPYSALSSQQPSPYAVGHSPSDAVAASLYARQRYAGYGGTGAAAAAMAWRSGAAGEARGLRVSSARRP